MADNKQPKSPIDLIAPGDASPEMSVSAPVPDLTIEEVVILGKEGEAALHEMGESLSDPSDMPGPIPGAEKPK